MPIVALVVGRSECAWISYFGAAVLFYGIWIELIYVLHWTPIARIRSRRIELEANLSRFIPNFKVIKTDNTGDRDKDIEHFFRMWFFLIPNIVFSYAAIYRALNLLAVEKWGTSAFDGITENSYKFASLIYFSIVTFATVGYGDISPAKCLFWPRILVASEIVSGLIVLVAMIARVSVNVSLWPTSNHKEEGGDTSSKSS